LFRPVLTQQVGEGGAGGTRPPGASDGAVAEATDLDAAREERRGHDVKEGSAENAVEIRRGPDYAVKLTVHVSIDESAR